MTDNLRYTWVVCTLIICVTLGLLVGHYTDAQVRIAEMEWQVCDD